MLPTAPPAGVRDHLRAVPAYTGGRGARRRVGSYKTTGGHRVQAVYGRSGKERRVPLDPEAFERLEAWLDVAGIRADLAGPEFRSARAARGPGHAGFALRPLTRRAVHVLVKRYARALRLDMGVTVHSLRVAALTTARERGSDTIDLQGFAGPADPRTTLTDIRSRDRLSKSPVLVLKS